MPTRPDRDRYKNVSIAHYLCIPSGQFFFFWVCMPTELFSDSPCSLTQSIALSVLATHGVLPNGRNGCREMRMAARSAIDPPIRTYTAFSIVCARFEEYFIWCNLRETCVQSRTAPNKIPPTTAIIPAIDASNQDAP